MYKIYVPRLHKYGMDWKPTCEWIYQIKIIIKFSNFQIIKGGQIRKCTVASP